MSPRDDDQGVHADRDDAAIAGQAMTGDDAALVGFVELLREEARRPAPTPSAELAALLTDGLGPESTSAGPEVVELGAARARRRRAARYVIGAGVAASLALGGSAAAAAVRDGVPPSEVPGEIGHRISTTVTGALEALGLRPDAPATDPLPGSSESSAPGRSGDAPGQQGGTGDEPGRSGEAPGAPEATPAPGEAPGRSGEAPGRPAETPVPLTTDPGRSGEAPGRQDPTGEPSGEPGAHDGQGSDGDQGAEGAAGATSPVPARRP